MISVRLVTVMVLYALLVAGTLVTITVVFSVLSRNAMKGQVRSLAQASMSGVKQTTVDQIQSYESTIYQMAMLLERLNLIPPLGATGQNISDYAITWDVMSIPEMNVNSTFISTFGMWLDTATNLWYMTGCSRETQLCSLYDAAANTTQFANYRRNGSMQHISPFTAVTVAGSPSMYSRYLSSLPLHTQLDNPGWWSFLYLDYAHGIQTHTCNNVAVAKTLDYFYCMEYYTPDSSDTVACKKLVGATVEATGAGTFEQSQFIESSIIHLASTVRVDNVNGLCDPADDVAGAVATFLSNCKAELLSSCEDYLKLSKPYVYNVIGYSQTNGVSFVIADKAPHSFFFSDIDHSQKVAIAISVVMIALVVVMSIIVSISIAMPISFICASMKNVSNLTDERQMAPITRYTVLSEVRQLCASYLDLRQAMKDLKAFMPQGLLVGPDEGMDTSSLLSALMDGDRYLSENDSDTDCDDDEASMDDGNGGAVDCEVAGRAGGYDTPDAATSDDAFVQLTDATRRQSVAAPPTLYSSPVYEDVDDESPLPMQHRRGTVHGGNYSGQNGIVSVVAVNTVDEALAQDTGPTARAGAVSAAGCSPRMQDSVITTPPVPQQSSPFSRGQNHQQHSNPMKLPRLNETSVDRHNNNSNKCRNGYSTLNGNSSHGEETLLRLNRSVYNGDVNKFRSVNCTLLCIRFAFEYIDERSLENEVNQLMHILVRVILRHGGIIEVFRPDLIFVSFGAHAGMSLHTQRATAAAITITKKLTVAQRARTRIIIDTGSFYCGTCGSNGRVSPVLFGDRFDAAFELLRYDLVQGRLVVTDRVALCLPRDFVVPFDYLVTLRGRSQGCQLFLVLNPAKRNNKEFRDSAMEFRKAYTLAISGKYREALEIVSRGGQFDPELASYCVKTFKYLLTMNPTRPRYCRFQLPSFEPLGVTIKETVPKYQHDRLRLNEIEREDEGHVSINFGFGGMDSCSNTASNIHGNGSVSQSRMLGENSFASNAYNSLKQRHGDSISVESVNSTMNNHHLRKETSVQSPPSQRRHCVFSEGTTTSARGFVVTDEEAAFTADKVSGGMSWGRLQGGQKKDYSPSILRAGDTGCTNISEEGLPLVFVDHKGERWHRFPNMIGSGAFAEVYKAISENGSLMALKCIHLAATNVQLADVVTEVNTACKLFSDFIVNHIGWAHVGSYMLIIMDYMSGGSLHSAMSVFPNGMTLQVARRYASDSVRGLAYLHRSGVVHADFKPQNILLASDGGCRISDFGSSVTKSNARSSGGDVFHLRGTPAYMSPEVARGDPPSMKSDMWSFGITLYELLTGHQPWVMKKSTGPPTGPGGLFPTEPQSAVAGTSPATSATSAGAAVVVAEAARQGNTRSDVHGVKTGNGHGDTVYHHHHHHHHHKNNDSRLSATEYSVVAATPPPRLSRLPEVAPAAPVVEWVPVQGLSDIRFVQAVANGSLQVRVEQKDLPTIEAYELIVSCLQEAPEQRPISWEAVDHPFFFP